MEIGLISVVSFPLNPTCLYPSIRDSGSPAIRLPGPPAEGARRPATAEVPLPLAGSGRRQQRREQDLLQPSGEAGLTIGPLSSYWYGCGNKTNFFFSLFVLKNFKHAIPF